MKAAGVEVVHLSTCMRGKDPNYAELAAKIAADFDVVGYTHGPEQGKNTKTQNICRKI